MELNMNNTVNITCKSYLIIYPLMPVVKCMRPNFAKLFTGKEPDTALVCAACRNRS
jgi:hypothetical protein